MSLGKMSVGSDGLSKSYMLASSPLMREFKQPGVDSSVVDEVREKLDKLPQYSTQRSHEIRRLAIRLTNTLEMSKFFTEYLQERNAFLVVPRPPHSQATLGEDNQFDDITAINGSEGDRLTLEQTVLLEDANRESLLENLSRFSVKLHITLEPATNTIEMSLQLGNQVVEWTRQNVIIPHKHIPPQALVTIDLSDCLMKMLLSRNLRSSQQCNGSADVDDRVLRLCRARSFLIEHIVKQCTIFNRFYYYETGAHDSQDFVKNIMATLKLECLPFLSTKLSDYITDLENGDGMFPLEDHTDHEELDNYVSEHSEDMSEGLIEYMTLLYYKHHLNMRADSDNPGSDTWKCPRRQCLLKTLELKLIK